MLCAKDMNFMILHMIEDAKETTGPKAPVQEEVFTLYFLQSGSVPPRTNVAAVRLNARESIVHCSSSSRHQHRLVAAELLDEQWTFFAEFARTH
jgi:hypothetical protein